MKNPYDEAAKVDKIINKVLAENPIIADPEGWPIFIRTIKSGLEILERVLEETKNDTEKKRYHKGF